MYEHKNIYPLVRMAKVLKVSESGYYAWRKKMQAAPSPNDKLNEELLDKILEIFIASRGSFGSRKITRIINSNRQKVVLCILTGVQPMHLKITEYDLVIMDCFAV